MTLARTKQLRRGGRSNPAVHPALAAHQYGSAGICRLEPPQLMHFDTTVNSSSFTSDQKVTGSSHVGRATSTILALVRRGKWRCNHQSGPRRTTSKPASIAALACPTSCVIKRAIFSSSIAARCKRSSERQSFSDELADYLGRSAWSGIAKWPRCGQPLRGTRACCLPFFGCRRNEVLLSPALL
jgi:hypothetical protein